VVPGGDAFGRPAWRDRYSFIASLFSCRTWKSVGTGVTIGRGRAAVYRIKSAPSLVSGLRLRSRLRSTASTNRIATIKDGAQPEICWGDLPPQLMAGVRRPVCSRMGCLADRPWWSALSPGKGVGLRTRDRPFDTFARPRDVRIKGLWSNSSALGIPLDVFSVIVGLGRVGRGVSVPPLENVTAR
jgi:hypothetical protein